MNENKNFGRSVENFFAGKGFYIVLFVCMAIIGVSAWVFLFAGDGESGSVGTSQNVPGSILDIDGDVMTGTWEDEAEESIAPAEENIEETATAVENTGETDVQTAKDLTFVWPLDGEIINCFSNEELVYNKTMADWRTHEGIDVATEIGTRVTAVADGTVTEVYNDDLYGTTVAIKHANGLVSVYSNLATVPTVSVGDYVTAGLVIGAVGDTAIAETNEVQHLHFAMTKNGTAVDPEKYLPKR